MLCWNDNVFVISVWYSRRCLLLSAIRSEFLMTALLPRSGYITVYFCITVRDIISFHPRYSCVNGVASLPQCQWIREDELQWWLFYSWDQCIEFLSVLWYCLLSKNPAVIIPKACISNLTLSRVTPEKKTRNELYKYCLLSMWSLTSAKKLR